MSMIQVFTLFAVMTALAAIPSSSVALVVARSATFGVRNGVAVAIGIVLGDLVFVLLAILGLTAVAELLGSFFVVLKMLGGLYLIWLGVAIIRSKGLLLDLSKANNTNRSLLASFLAGIFLTLGDIKAIFFYASLLPMFVDLTSPSVSDYALVVAITILSVGSVKVIYAFLGSRVAAYAQRKKPGKFSQKVAGGALVGAGGFIVVKP